MAKTSSGLANLIREKLHPLVGASSDYDPLIQQIGDAQFVLSIEGVGEPAETFPWGL